MASRTLGLPCVCLVRLGAVSGLAKARLGSVAVIRARGGHGLRTALRFACDRARLVLFSAVLAKSGDSVARLGREWLAGVEDIDRSLFIHKDIECYDILAMSKN